MLKPLTFFAGPVCFGPSTEKENFIWLLVIGAILLALFSLLLGLAALIVKLRHTFNPRRIWWTKLYALSILMFLSFIGLGWTFGSGVTITYACDTIQTTTQGNIFVALTSIAAVAALISLLGFIFSFTHKPTKN